MAGWRAGLGVMVVSAGVALACGGSSDDGVNAGAGATDAGTGAGGSGATGTGGSGTGGSGATGTGGTAAGGSGNYGGGGGQTAADCFADIMDGPVQVNYDQFGPTINSTCSGTNHQAIQDVELVVYLGDSITNGDYVSPKYVSTLTPMLKDQFPGVEVRDCSSGGDRNRDFFSGSQQIPKCFPDGGDQKKTLVIITMGGNDLAGMAQDSDTFENTKPTADAMIALKREAITWLKDPARFPNGSSVVFANVYEYTDASANMSSCPAAGTAGLSGTWTEGMKVISYINENYMQIAVDTGADMIFMQEHFCGHGFMRDDATLQCYRGPGADAYFDFTCIHPNGTGAEVIANLFFDTVTE